MVSPIMYYKYKLGTKQGHVLVHMISDTFLSMRGASSLRRGGECSSEAICVQSTEDPRPLTGNGLCSILSANLRKGVRRCRR